MFIEDTLIAIRQQECDFGQREAEFLQMQYGPEPVQRFAAILAIASFRSALRCNQPFFFLQAQLTTGHVGRLAQGAGRLQSLESLYGNYAFHILFPVIESKGVILKPASRPLSQIKYAAALTTT